MDVPYKLLIKLSYNLVSNRKNLPFLTIKFSTRLVYRFFIKKILNNRPYD
ncbi:hypothetical protein RVIR1_12670 [Candidatus Rickettsiella viridis]|uniref:Uncharacterized protein n=1 Tax=Candidatus Rickettsiella viridis TaxID=676208 RepID=A0A2Z5V5N3_9COXI|nr:hypothetical protein RVIR1_12670 [Candidatus Rickettsiella viridis]